MIRIKRAYEPSARGDGRRLLVERLWPRGMRKEALLLDAWVKEVAPSTELRKWFGHDPERWTEFRRRYEAELTGERELLTELRAREDDEAAVRDFGVAYATLQCAELLAGGAPGVHFYTLNRSPATRAIFESLRNEGLVG